jgi:hypothetical protein
VLAFKPDTVTIHPDRVAVSIVWRAEVTLATKIDPRALTVAAGVATHEHPLRMKKRLEDCEIERAQVSNKGAPSIRENAGTVVLDPSPVELAPTAIMAAPVANARGIRAWLTETTASKAPESAPEAVAPAASAGSSTADRLRAWTSGKGLAPDATAIPGSEPAVSLPFEKGKPAVPPPPAKQVRSASRGDTVIGGAKRADKTLPFATDRDREAALAKKAEIEQQLAAERAAEAARKAQADEKARLAKELDDKREAERKKFEADEALRLRTEAERKELAAKQARADAQKVEDALYGGLKKKPKK